jgi:hypothetical protein
MIFKGVRMSFILLLPANEFLVFLFTYYLLEKFVHHWAVFFDEARDISEPIPDPLEAALMV